ncbi:MAG TPA: TetR/AcrR family transcriptional regulator [Allosphingosinicella sp.]|nr:TetR/AcrR family transcriptional regulator [Allosphingosinicella sp.]
MRVRTDEKRQEIVEIAAQLFEEQGYDRTSMSQISQRLGGSKATLYGYFKSKEELLLATLDYDVGEQADRLMNQLLGAKSLRKGLVLLGIGYMERLLDRRPISNVRIVSSQPEESGIGRIFYENVLLPAWQRLANRFRMMMDEGLLRRADPWVAAMHWKGLVEWDMFDRRLMGAISEGDPKEIRKAATLAADVFLQVYGANGGDKPLAGTPAAAPLRRGTTKPNAGAAAGKAAAGTRAGTKAKGASAGTASRSRPKKRPANPRP